MMNEKEESPKVKFNQKDYVKCAEDVIKYLEKEEFSVITNPKNSKRGSKDTLTTSAIRNILSSTSEIYDMVRSQGPEAVRDKLAYLKVKLIYQSGRNAAVKRFVKVSKLIQALDRYYQKPDEKAMIILFCRYMEALVAYFKYYGGKD